MNRRINEINCGRRAGFAFIRSILLFLEHEVIWESLLNVEKKMQGLRMSFGGALITYFI